MYNKLAEIIHDSINYSDGSFDIEYAEGYDSLSESDKIKVEDAVDIEISDCACCGWFFAIGSLEESKLAEGGVCWKCAEQEKLE